MEATRTTIAVHCYLGGKDEVCRQNQDPRALQYSMWILIFNDALVNNRIRPFCTAKNLRFRVVFIQKYTISMA